jgi:putative peptidoglycan lipid II flippase
MIKQTLVLSGINLSGKALGLLKVIILASIYGAGTTYDAFIIAYTLPTLLPQILTTIITTIFIPQFHKKDRTSIESWHGLNVLFTFVIILSLFASLALFLFAENIVTLIAPGITDTTFSKAVILFRIMSVTTFVIGVSSYFIALSNAKEKFYLASIDGLIINSLVILYCFVYRTDSNIETVSILIVSGFFIHLITLLNANKETIRSNIRFNFNYRHDDFIKPMSKSIPIVVGYIGALSTGIVDQWFSSYEDSGAISILSYATMLYLLPMEVFGKAVMQTYYTRFSTLSSEQDKLANSYSEGIKLILFIMLPISLFLLFSNYNLISLIFERGNFSSDSTQLTSYVLSALALGLIFRIFTYFNYRLLHSRGRSWSAISIGLAGVLINIISNILLAPNFGLIGIATATTISLLFSAIISYILIRKDIEVRFLSYLDRNTIKIIIVSILSITIYSQISTTALNSFCVSNNQSCIIGINILTLMTLPFIFFLFGYISRVNEVRYVTKYLSIKKC